MRWLAGFALLLVPAVATAAPPVLLQPDRVFDGTAAHAGWAVLVEG
jgi:hypothetical protein